MARKPANESWIGVTPAQARLLDDFDFYGNNGWDRNGQTDELMPALLKQASDEGLTVAAIVEAMQSVGYDPGTTRQIERWERKRTTGKFGR